MRGVGLFSDFNEEQLRLLVFGSQKLSFPAGTYIFHDGQSTDGGFVIFEGRVKLVDEREQTISQFKTGDLVGEMAILTRNKRVGSAIVVDDCELLKISRATMHRILGEYPELAAVLYQKIADNVSDFAKKLGQVERRLQSSD